MNEKKMSNFVMAGLFMCLGLMLLGIVLDNLRHKPTPVEKAVTAQKETVQKMHQRVMAQLVSTSTGSEVYQGTIYLRNGKIVTKRSFKYQTIEDIVLAIKGIKNDWVRMGEKCIFEDIDFVGNSGLAVGISCEPKK